MHDTKKWIGGGAVILILLSLLMLYLFNNNANLPEYTGSEVSIVSATPEPHMMDTQLWQGENYTVEVPLQWEQVILDGFETFIHAPSQSSIQIQIYDYQPKVNIFNSDTMNQVVSNAGGNLVDFIVESTSEYEVMYTMGEFAYLADVKWNMEKIYASVCSTPIEHYDKMRATMLHCIETLTITAGEPIPETHFLYYSEFGDFEFGVPASYTFGVSGSTLAASNETTGITYTVTVSQSDFSIHDMTELDYSSIASQNRDNFILQSFYNSHGSVQASATFLVDGVQHFLLQDIVSNDEFEYVLSLTGPVGNEKEDISLFDISVNQFRYFSSGNKDAESNMSSALSPEIESSPNFEADENGNLFYYQE